jgi:hypothetical protein
MLDTPYESLLRHYTITSPSMDTQMFVRTPLVPDLHEVRQREVTVLWSHQSVREPLR